MEVKYQNIKPSHDELRLALFAPDGIHIYVHDGKIGKSTTGKKQESEGGQIQIRGPRNEPDPWAALNVIKQKMAHMLIGSILF